MIIKDGFFLFFTDADLHGEVDGPDLSGDDRSITSDIQDATEANLDHDSMDSDREALNLVSILSALFFTFAQRQTIGQRRCW